MTSLLESLPIINCLQVVQFLASESIRHWRPISRSLIPSTNSLVTKKNHLAFSPRSFETGIVVLALTSCSTSTSFSMRYVANILALLMSNLLWETVRGFSCWNCVWIPVYIVLGCGFGILGNQTFGSVWDVFMGGLRAVSRVL